MDWLEAEARRGVSIKHVKGSRVNASSSFGSLVIEGIDGSVNASAHGSVNINKVGGNIQVSSSFGGSTIRNVRSVLRVSTRGDIDIKAVRLNVAEARSSYGSIRVCSISREWSRHVVFQVDCNPKLGGPHALEQDHSQGL